MLYYMRELVKTETVVKIFGIYFLGNMTGCLKWPNHYRYHLDTPLAWQNTFVYDYKTEKSNHCVLKMEHI